MVDFMKTRNRIYPLKFSIDGDSHSFPLYLLILSSLELPQRAVFSFCPHPDQPCTMCQSLFTMVFNPQTHHKPPKAVLGH